MRRLILSVFALFLATPGISPAQGRGGGLPDSVKARRWAIENELQSLAVVRRNCAVATVVPANYVERVTISLFALRNSAVISRIHHGETGS